MPRHTSAESFYARVRARHGDSIVLGEYTKAKNRIDARCVRCGHEWQPIAQTLYENGCYPCNKRRAGQAHKGNSFTYKFQLWQKFGERVRLRGQYVAAMTPTEHYCRVHRHIFMVRPQGMLRGNLECCTAHSYTQRGLKRRLSEAEVHRRIKAKHGKRVQMIGSYEGTLTHHRFRCDKGHEWEAIPDAVARMGSGCPTCNNGHRYSQAAIRWLTKIEASLGRPLQHAERGGEKVIEVKGRRLRVDGYDPVTHTVYEFHGDAFHGNIAVFDPADRPNPFQPEATALELFRATKEKEYVLQTAGCAVVVLWERDWNAGRNISYRLSPQPQLLAA